MPACLDSLGLPAAQFDRHIAWDIGAAALALALGRRLEALVIRQTYSRLVIDCNRAPGRPDLIPAVSDGAVIPANQGLDTAAAAARLAAIHRPYHDRIAGALDRRAAEGRPAVVVSVHSFTPVFQGFVRPWHVGVLHDGASAASLAILDLLAAEADLTVGDNQPYAMDGTDYTVPVHAVARGLPYLELEIRQDLIAAEEGVERFADLLARLIPRAFAPGF